MRPALLAAAAMVFIGCRKAAAPQAQEPHQTLDDFTLTQSDLGNPAWKLKARSALLREERKEADLSEPNMEFYKQGKVVTRLRSDTGVIDTDTTDLRLSSNVVVTSIEDNSVVRTEVLLYSSEKKKFYTDDDVAVTRPGGVLHGKGMEASPDLSEIRIFHQTSVVDQAPPP